MSLWPAPGAILLAAAVPGALMMFLLSFPGRIGPRGVTRRRVRRPLHQRYATAAFAVESGAAAVRAGLLGCPLVGRGRRTDCRTPLRCPCLARRRTVRPGPDGVLTGMEPHPHRYDVHARAGTEGSVLVESRGLPTLRTAPPTQYGGPGDQWSPETLLVAAAADCFVLTFRAIAA